MNKLTAFLAIFVMAASLTMVTHTEPAHANGRCAKWEGLLEAHGLPVAAFSRIMWRESRCQPGARNVNRNRSVDRGLLQINSIHLRKTGVAHGMDPQSLFDPETNVKIAARLYKRAGLRPWRATS